MSFSPQSLLAALPAPRGLRRYWVAFSGGLDSLVLLHALAALREQLGDMEVRAVHVDHGLSPNAGQWRAQCARHCETLGVPLVVRRTDAAPRPGESPEAAARAARYGILATLVAAGDCLLTAHHQDDQAETLLLQLLRGAGPKGLAAMPALTPFARGWHGRPLLAFRRDALLAYARQHELQWLEDESNFDTGYDRNFLRHEILPRLKQRFPGAAATLSRSARLCAEAAEVLADSARRDLATVRLDEGVLSISALRGLGEARSALLLHEWIGQQGLHIPSAAQTAAIWHEVINAAEDACPLVCWAGGEVRRYRDGLFVQAPLPAHDASRVFAWDLRGELAIPGLGRLGTETVVGQGLDMARLAGKILRVGFRQGGESLRPCGRAGRHSLKHLLQEWGVPPWRRDRLPLLWCDDALIAVADLCLSHDYCVAAGQRGLGLTWRPAEAG
jgi:tRNA(Ile)-lysidine synthase